MIHLVRRLVPSQHTAARARWRREWPLNFVSICRSNGDRSSVQASVFGIGFVIASAEAGRRLAGWLARWPLERRLAQWPRRHTEREGAPRARRPKTNEFFMFTANVASERARLPEEKNGPARIHRPDVWPPFPHRGLATLGQARAPVRPQANRFAWRLQANDINRGHANKRKRATNVATERPVADAPERQAHRLGGNSSLGCSQWPPACLCYSDASKCPSLLGLASRRAYLSLTPTWLLHAARESLARLVCWVASLRRPGQEGAKKGR